MSETATPKARKSAKKEPNAPSKVLQDFIDKGDGEDLALRAIAMLLWKNRHANPEMSVQVHEHDITKLEACANYLKITPQVQIYRPEGLPAQDAVPAIGNRRAIPARKAEGPKPFVVIQLVDEKGNGFVPIENSEEDAQLRDERRELNRLRDRAPALAAQMEADIQAGAFSDSTLREACRTLVALAKAVK